MADPKDSKGAKSEGKPIHSGSVIEESAILMMILLVLLLLSKWLAVLTGTGILNKISDYFSKNVAPFLILLSAVLTLFFIYAILRNIMKLTALNREINSKYENLTDSASLANLTADVNRKWERIMTHLNSINPNDWKFAILEADIMLSDLLDTLQYHGATMAEKLKAVERSDFSTLESAWEAHKTRNTIAHEGSDFVLTEREARRVIGLYESVFREFKII